MDYSMNAQRFSCLIFILVELWLKSLIYIVSVHIALLLARTVAQKRIDKNSQSRKV